jgi:hypothetical protein
MSAVGATRRTRTAYSARLGILDHREPACRELPEHENAARVYAVATDKGVRFDAALNEWLGTVDIQSKSKELKRAPLATFTEELGDR